MKSENSIHTGIETTERLRSWMYWWEDDKMKNSSEFDEVYLLLIN